MKCNRLCFTVHCDSTEKNAKLLFPYENNVDFTFNLPGHTVFYLTKPPKLLAW